MFENEYEIKKTRKTLTISSKLQWNFGCTSRISDLESRYTMFIKKRDVKKVGEISFYTNMIHVFLA